MQAQDGAQGDGMHEAQPHTTQTVHVLSGGDLVGGGGWNQ